MKKDYVRMQMEASKNMREGFDKTPTWAKWVTPIFLALCIIAMVIGNIVFLLHFLL